MNEGRHQDDAQDPRVRELPEQHGLHAQGGPVWLIGWGTGTIDAESVYVPLFRTGSNLGNYQQPDFDGMVDQAQSMIGRKAEARALPEDQQALDRGRRGGSLYQQMDLYGANKRLNWKARSDEAIKAYDMSIK
jgi:hypothetical protein